jgi:hypothetical protein
MKTSTLQTVETVTHILWGTFLGALFILLPLVTLGFLIGGLTDLVSGRTIAESMTGVILGIFVFYLLGLVTKLLYVGGRWEWPK